MKAFLDFLASPAGIAVYCIVAVAIVVFFFSVNYRFFAKRALDVIFGALLAAVTSPVLGICAAVCRYRAGRVFDYIVIAGRDGEPVKARVFCAGGGLGKRISRLPLLLSVVTGGLSFIGPALLTYTESVLVPEEYSARFGVRPGLLAAASESFDSQPEYPELFAADCRYPENYSLSRDIRTLFVRLFRALRGEGWRLEPGGYIASLQTSGKLNEEELVEAEQLSREEQLEYRRRKMRVG